MQALEKASNVLWSLRLHPSLALSFLHIRSSSSKQQTHWTTRIPRRSDSDLVEFSGPKTTGTSVTLTDGPVLRGSVDYLGRNRCAQRKPRLVTPSRASCGTLAGCISGAARRPILDALSPSVYYVLCQVLRYYLIPVYRLIRPLLAEPMHSLPRHAQLAHHLSQLTSDCSISVPSRTP
ncbi:hypothetical protein LX36DRAFT_443715 [Colletotrichum falcatum]|nr:hypothetical protein LX36DRAFT_443715 [Colletotrichum falcatum]